VKTIEFAVVAMKDVPEPPRLGRAASSPYVSVYTAMRRAGFNEANAVRVPMRDQKHLNYVRGQLRNMAKRDKLLLCSSRTEDCKLLYVWLVNPTKA
jgi:hypothetical protein